MKLFLMWTGALFLVIAAFFVYLMKSRNRKFHFQTRVTIVLLLLTLAPAVPLIMLSIELVNRGIENLGSRNIDEIFTRSLTTIRSQLMERNGAILDRLESRGEGGDTAKLEGVLYALRVHASGEKLLADTLFSAGRMPGVTPSFDRETFETVLSRDMTGTLDRENRVFESYRSLPDSSLLVVGMPVDASTVGTISRLETARSSLGLIYLFFIRGNLGYIMATVFVFVLTIVAVTVAWRFSKGITGPIKELVNGFKRVGEGDFDVRVSTDAKDEVHFLMNSFNTMIADLKQTHQKLLHSERIAAWRDVARRISHEIKNSLTPIQLSLHRLKKKISVSEDHAGAVAESFRTIGEEIESLKKIATEFSEFARMPKPRFVRASLNDTIQSAAALFEKNRHAVRLILDLSGDLPDAFFDPAQMKRVLINLIANGLEATGNSGNPLTISSTPAGSCIRVSVSDGGTGMDGETLRHIFDPYFTTKREGTGLGMPIIKRIIDEHGGDISVKSSPGKGTTVTFTILQESPSRDTPRRDISANGDGTPGDV